MPGGNQTLLEVVADLWFFQGEASAEGTRVEVPRGVNCEDPPGKGSGRGLCLLPGNTF